MNRTTRTVVVMTVATLLAGIASLGVYAAIKSIPVREVEVAHTFVAVAARNLPTGSRITEQDVKLVAWPARNPVPGAFSELKPILDRGLVAAIGENEPFTETKLAPVGSGAGLPPSIPSGMRAMSVKVDEVIGVAGFVVPGTRVDLVVTLRGGGQSEESMSRTVASNVLVLTAGTKFDQEQAKDGKAQPSSVVTLAVSPSDAERVALASSEGKISLALRNPLDVAPTDTQGVHVGALRLGPGAAPRPEPVKAPTARRPMSFVPQPQAAAAPVSAQKLYTVEAIRGAKRTQESVK